MIFQWHTCLVFFLLHIFENLHCKGIEDLCFSSVLTGVGRFELGTYLAAGWRANNYGNPHWFLHETASLYIFPKYFNFILKDHDLFILKEPVSADVRYMTIRFNCAKFRCMVTHLHSIPILFPVRY